MSAVVRGDAHQLPLADESVDLIVTSPPYFALRSYRDGGEHYDGQIGSEPTPQAFLEALWAVTAECWRVLKPSGSMFVNLGDKRSGSGGGNSNTGLGYERGEQAEGVDRFTAPRRYTQAAFGRAKSKMLLPHRYAIGCEDGAADPEGIGWIVRQDIVWSKPNGLPESVRDRTRDAHEYWFHLTKHGDYFAAVDEIRTPSTPQPGLAGTFARPNGSHDVVPGQVATQHRADRADVPAANPLGALPRSVWEIPTEPLTIPDWLGIDHFAAFPSEWPRRLILGWSPNGICTACGEGRAPVIERTTLGGDNNPFSRDGSRTASTMDGGSAEWAARMETPDTITGYACACPDATAPTRPAVVLDPFGGTGTTAMVARALGRHGISVDLSADYCRLARWRIFQSGHGARAVARTNAERQGALL